MCFALSARNPARTVWTWPQLEPQVEGSVTFDKERCASFHFVTSHHVHLQECVKIEVLCTNGGLDKVYSVYSEYTLKFGFIKVWTKKLYSLLHFWDNVNLWYYNDLRCWGFVLQLVNKEKIWDFYIFDNDLCSTSLKRAARNWLQFPPQNFTRAYSQKMSFWWTMYTRPPAPLKYAPVYMYEDFYMHCIDLILSWILRDRWCHQNRFNRALT